MSIQSTINQGISVLSILWSQTPYAEKSRQKAATPEIVKREVSRQEQIKAAAEEERLASQAKSEADFQAMQRHVLEGEGKAGVTTGEKEVEMKAYADWANLARQRYLSNPTDETYEDWKTIESGYHEARDWEEAKKASERQKHEEAKRKAAEAQALEQERIARSRQLTRTITEGIPLSPSSQKYVEKRIETGGKQ